MSDIVIDREIRRKIIHDTHKCFYKKERDKLSKSTTIRNIVDAIKKEISENADQ